MNIATPVNALALTVDRNALVAALTIAARTTEKRNSIPILSCALLAASPQGLVITTTDLDQTIAVPVTANVSASGSIAVDAHQLLKMAKQLAAGDVSLSFDGDRLAVVAGRSRFALPTLSPLDFPSDPVTARIASFELGGQELARYLGRTAFARSTETTRFYLNGVFFHVASNEFRAVATDGHRLSLVVGELPEGAGDMAGPDAYGFKHHGYSGFILPNKACAELEKLVAKSAAPVTVELQRTRLIFAGLGWTLTTKFIDATFPDYGRVMPRTDATMTVNRAAMAESLKRVCAVTNRPRAVKLNVAEGELVLTVTDAETGTASEGIDAIWKRDADKAEADSAHAPLEIGFNAQYLAGMLDEVQADSFVMLASDYGTPVKFLDGTDSGVTLVLMPMRV
jgi:DNA polymerase-3 subunit beta